MTDQSISLCIVVRHDGPALARCLQSARAVAQEVVLVDLSAQADIPEIAQRFDARLWPYANRDDEAAAWNYAVEKATGRWILAMEANEELPPSSHLTLRRNVIPWQDEGPLLYYLGRYLFFPDKERSPARARVLFPKITLFPRHTGFRFVQPAFPYLRFEGPADMANWMKVPDMVIYHYVHQGPVPDLQQMEQMAVQNPDDLAVRFQYCRLLYLRKDYRRTLQEAYAIAQANYPENRINPLNVALICYFGAFSALQLGLAYEAADLALTGIWKQYSLPGLWQVLALAYTALEDQPTRIEQIDRDLHLDVARRWLEGQSIPEMRPYHWGAFFLLGCLHCLHEQYDTAARLFQQSGTLVPDFAAPFIAQIETALFAQDPDSAIRVVRERGPRFPQFRETLTELETRLDKFKRSAFRSAAARRSQLQPVLDLLTPMKEEWTS